MCQSQTLNIIRYNLSEETFTIRMALYFDYFIFFTTRGTSRIFLEILETELLSHLNVYQLSFFPLYCRSKKTHDLTYYFIWMFWSL